MTNKQLQKAFEDINLHNDNIFDKYMEVEKLSKEYKTTTFAKTTGKTVFEAYELYNSHEGKVDSLIQLLDNDYQLEKLFQKVIAVFDLEGLMNTMTPENKALMTELLPLINK
jgi:hypothetical protein